MDINILRELVMVAALAVFGGIVWWAYAPSRKQRFERDARSVLADEECDRATRAELLGEARQRKGD
jgi:cbb3-type cytochrome oxidase subunit 3